MTIVPPGLPDWAVKQLTGSGAIIMMGSEQFERLLEDELNRESFQRVHGPKRATIVLVAKEPLST